MSKTKSFAKLKEIYPMPHLLDIQLLSFGEFLQRDAKPDARETVGLQEAFCEVFPIESFDKRFRLEFVSYTLGKPKYSIEECPCAPTCALSPRTTSRSRRCTSARSRS